MKKLISMLLALTLVLALVPTVFAEGEATKFTWKDFDGTNTVFQDDSRAVFPASASDKSAVPYRAWAMQGQGDKKGYLSHEKAGYAGRDNANYEENGTGMATHLFFPSTIADDTYAVKFDFKREFDSVSRLETRHVGQNEWDHDALSIMIDKNGNVTVQGNKIENVGANEWHTFVLETTVSSEEGKELNVYLDGTKYGPYTNTAEFTKQPVENFSIYATAYTNNLVKTLNQTRSALRPESLYIKNLVVTNDMDVAFPAELSFYNVKPISQNEVLFSASKEIEVPDAASVIIDGVAAVKTEEADSNSFKATTASNLTIYKTIDYEVTIDGEKKTGRFYVNMPDIYESFDNGVEGKPETYYGFAYAGMTPYNDKGAGFLSHMVALRDGKEGGTGDKAFGWSSEQKANKGSGYANLSKDNSIVLDWFNYVANMNEGGELCSEDRFVLSADFMRGSERVGFLPFAFIGDSRDYRKGNMLIEFTPNDEFKVGGDVKKNNIKPLEWHNVTVHIMISSYGKRMDVYLDGELVAEGLTVDNFRSIRTIGENETLEDSNLSNLYNTDPKRNDIIIIDNMYIGRDFDYKTSNIVATASENDVTLYTGAIKGGNPMISALYTSEGKLKDIKIGNLPEGRFQKTTVTDALDMEAGDGEVVKFFVVNNLLNLRPISNVIVK